MTRGALHALYAFKTSVAHLSDSLESMDKDHPHTFYGDADKGYVLPADFEKYEYDQFQDSASSPATASYFE